MHKLRENAEKELKAIEEKGLTSSNLDNAYKLVEIMKGVDKIEMMEEGGGYSQDGYSRDWKITAGSVAGIPVTAITAGRGTTPTTTTTAIPTAAAGARLLVDMSIARTIPACLVMIRTWTSTGAVRWNIPTAGTI